MADEYLERYGRLTHDELHRQLLAGSPAGVDAVADAWHTVEDNVGLLAANLRSGLTTLLASWSGVGSEEYQRRLGLIATLADGLAQEALAVRTGLGLMSAHLAEAQSRAEPDAGGPAEWAFDGVLGPALGRTLTTAQRSAAQQRMAQVVAGAALAYRLADHRHWPRTLPLAADRPARRRAGAPRAGPRPRPGPRRPTQPARRGPRPPPRRPPRPARQPRSARRPAPRHLRRPPPGPRPPPGH